MITKNAMDELAALNDFMALLGVTEMTDSEFNRWKELTRLARLPRLICVTQSRTWLGPKSLFITVNRVTDQVTRSRATNLEAPGEPHWSPWPRSDAERREPGCTDYACQKIHV